MKNKIVILLLLAVFFVPSVSNASGIPGEPPQANLTIIANTEEETGFVFNIQVKNNDNWDYFFRFYDETENLSYSRDITLSPVDKEYWLQLESTEGEIVKYVHCTSDNLATVFLYQQLGVTFAPKEDENIICTFDNVETQTKNPVLIVPGLLGTEMKKGDELLWADPARMLLSITDDFMDPLAFNKDLTPSNSVTLLDVIRSKTAFNYAEGLINEFKNLGYTEGTGADNTLFTFPYDWRYGASGEYTDGKTNSDLLGEKIGRILYQTGSDKVDIVAHSLGGLIVKKYVMDAPTMHHIGKTIFIGVPNTGAPKAVKALLQGDNFGISFGPFGLDDQEMKKLAENMPASYDLLPSRQYYNQKGSFVSQVDIGYGIGTPTEKDLNYQEFENYLISDYNLNSQGFLNAESFHSQTFDDFDLRTAGIDLYAIDGCKTGTMTNFVEIKYKDILGNNYTDYNKVELNAGDGTVPLESSTNLPINENNKFYFLKSDHSKMLSADGSRQEIVNLVSGSNLDVANNLITQDINECNLNGKAISVFSPVDVFVTDQNGNRLGLAEDGSIINEIPNADFEVMGEHKFLYLSKDDGEVYSINLTGTDSGIFTIKSQDIIAGQARETEVFSNLPVTAQLTGGINLNSDNTITLLIKEMSDSVETIIPPSATLTAEQSEDVLHPSVTAILTGTAGQPGFYINPVFVKINASDADSGVLDIEYNLDDMGYQKISADAAEIKIVSEGKHKITFFAADKAGNNSLEQIINFEIINLPTNKNQCKKDGWRKYGDTFKNQGECVSFVESKKQKPKKD